VAGGSGHRCMETTTPRRSFKLVAQ
jgi:hypothetical protein